MHGRGREGSQALGLNQCSELGRRKEHRAGGGGGGGGGRVNTMEERENRKAPATTACNRAGQAGCAQQRLAEWMHEQERTQPEQRHF